MLHPTYAQFFIFQSGIFITFNNMLPLDSVFFVIVVAP